MAKKPRYTHEGVRVKVKLDDSEGDRRARLSKFEVLSIRVVVGEKHIEKCFYDDIVLEKIENLSKAGYASYRCPECNRGYIMPVSDGERKKLEKKGKIKVSKERKYVDEKGIDRRVYLD